MDNYVENFCDMCDEVTKNASFAPDKVTNYPGVRPPISKQMVVGYLKPIMEILYGVYQFSDSFQPYPKDNYFSLITTPPSKISAMQSWPHFDTPNPNLIAVIHYLGTGNHGGTGFFHHKKSQLERIDNKTKANFYQYAEDYFRLVNIKSSINNYDYCTEHHSEFNCYKKIAYKPNRLIIFPGQLLHSTLVELNTDINSNPVAGRLTANLFVEFK